MNQGMENERKRTLIALLALALSTLAISLSWTGMKFPELGYGFKFFDLLSGWSLSYFIIAEVAIMPFAGKLIDVYGLKSLLATGVGVFLAGGALVMFAEESTSFLVGRIIQGLGAGIIFSVSMTAVGALLEGHPMRRMHGIMTGAFAIGSLFGMAFGYWVTIDIGADAFVPICTFVTVASGTVAYLYLPESAPHSNHDVLGSLLITLFMLDIMFFTQMVNNDFDLISTQTAIFIGTSVALLLLLVVVERRAADPIFPRTEESNQIGCILCMFLAGFCGLGILQYLIRFLMIGIALDVYTTSAMFLAFIAGAAITSLGIGRVLGRTGLRRWVLIGPIIVCLGLVFASQTITEGLEFVAVSMFILGLGLGCIVTPALCSLHTSTKKEVLGSTTSVVLSFRFVGILTGAAVYAGIVSWKLSDILISLEEALGTKSLDLLTNLLLILGDFFTGEIQIFEESITLCCLAAGILSLLILVAAYFTIKPDFGKDPEKEE